MSITYAQKQVPAQKKEAPGAVSIHDSSLQGEALQRKEDLVSGIVQRMGAPRPNNTGMPDNLKSGIESLSGYSMDNVRVHYNSSKPATVQALAYTQGTDIHVAPGQEKHLPHEAWHVAQQMAGRVAPTTNINGMPVNDNAALEHEADVMGEKAVTQRKEASGLNEASIGEGVCQRTEIHYHPMKISYIPTDTAMVDTTAGSTTETVGHITEAILTPGQPVKGTAPGEKEQEELMKAIKPDDGYSTNPFIKGHLLNHHLGGLGISQNMIPLTANANALHEKFVEQGVKNLVHANELVKNHGNNVSEKTVEDIDEEAKEKISSAKEAKDQYNRTHKMVLENQKIVNGASKKKRRISHDTQKRPNTDSVGAIFSNIAEEESESLGEEDAITRPQKRPNAFLLKAMESQLETLKEQEKEEKERFQKAELEKNEAIKKMATARIMTGQSKDHHIIERVNGETATIYKVQAHLVNTQPVSKKQGPEVLLSCSVKYGKNNSWNATIHSGPKPDQAAVDGNITDNINTFLSPTQQDPSESHINYLHVGKQELTDFGWGGLLKDPANPTNSDYKKGFDIIGSGIKIYHNDPSFKTDNIPLISMVDKPNTYINTPKDPNPDDNVELFKAMKAIDNIKEVIKGKIDAMSPYDDIKNIIKNAANTEKQQAIANILLND